MKNYLTEQENFWAGDIGNKYISRNKSGNLLASNLNFFSRALSNIKKIENCLEFGANVGMNLSALKLLYPQIDPFAIEINLEATKLLSEVIPSQNLFHQSILDFEPKRQWELVLIKGVLIHLNEDHLKNVYKKLVESTSKYLLICEYYNPTPTKIPYRGNENKLFKRDFAGELIDSHKNMHLINYGFVYHKDISFPQDDITWFLLEKK